MSEVVETAVNVTAGGLLRDARQSAGLHIDALAASLKVPVARLEALEADRYDALPDIVFTRALASSICRALKIDASPIMALLPKKEVAPLSSAGEGINAPVKMHTVKSSSSNASSFGGASSKPVMGVVVLLLVGALAMVFWPQSKTGSGGDAGVAGSSQSDVIAPVAPVMHAEPSAVLLTPPALPLAGADNVAAAVAAVPTEAPTTTAVPVATGADAAAAAGTSVASPVAPGTAAAAPVVSKETSPPGEAVPLGVLVLRARTESWVQVRDASGAIALQRSLAAGETAPVPGTPPFKVVIGRVDATEVFVRGQVFNLAAVARDNVARFEVK